MPDQQTIQRARKAKRAGKSPSTQAGEFIREEIHHIRDGKHGARSAKQAIAIGLSKARRAGVELGVPSNAPRQTQKSARSAIASRGRKPNRKRSRAMLGRLEREGRTAASSRSLSRQAR